MFSNAEGDDYIYFDPNTDSVSIASNNNIGIFLNSTSNVGIGTTNPNEKLTVVGGISATGNIYSNNIYLNRGNSLHEGGQINFNRAKDNTPSFAIDVFSDVSGGTDSRLRFIDTIAGSERMTMLSSGNVGIGTPNPAQTLTIIGNQSVSSTIAAPNATFSAINIDTGNAAVFYAQGTAPAVRITQTGSGHALLVEDTTTPDSSPFVINGSGNVGIGTTTPSAGYKLDVRGGIICNSNAILPQIDSSMQISTPKLATYASGDCLEYIYSQGITKQYIASWNASYTIPSQVSVIDLTTSSQCPFFALGQYANKIVINVILRLINATTGASQMGSYTGTYVINATPNAQGFIGYLANGSTAALTLATDYAPVWSVTMGVAPTIQATAATTTANGALNLTVRSHTGAGAHTTNLAFFVTSNVMVY